MSFFFFRPDDAPVYKYDPEKNAPAFFRRHIGVKRKKKEGEKEESGHMGGELNFVTNKPSLQNPILCTFQWKEKSGIQPDMSSGFFLGNGPHFVLLTLRLPSNRQHAARNIQALKVKNKDLVGPNSHPLLQEHLTSIIKSSYSFAYSPLFPLCFLQPHHYLNQHPSSACFSSLRPVLLLSLHCLRFPL